MSRKRHVSLQNRYWYFVSDYDMKQYLKTFFSKISRFNFGAHLRFLGRSQWRNQSERALARLASPIRKFNLKMREFKRVLNLRAGGGKGEDGGKREGLRC